MKSASAMYVCGIAMLATGAMAHSMDMRKVGFRETGGAHVENGTETPEGQFVIDSAAKFYKHIVFQQSTEVLAEVEGRPEHKTIVDHIHFAWGFHHSLEFCIVSWKVIE